jgi:hypothetical protein
VDDVQRLEAERLRRAPAAYPADELWRELIGALAALYATPPDTGVP